MTREKKKKKGNGKRLKFLENHRHIANFSSAPNSLTKQSGEAAEMLIHSTLELLRFFRVVEAAQEKAIPEQRGRYLVDQ